MALLPPVNEGEFGVETRDAPPAHLLFKIESFSKLSKHGIQKYESRVFVAGNCQWRVVIYPQVSGGGSISVYLSVVQERLPLGWEVKADCSILLHNQVSGNYLCFQGKTRRFDAMNPKWGFSISKKMLTEASNGFLVDDKCVFGAEVFLSETKTTANESLYLFDWKIPNFSQLESVLTSKVFVTGGFQWKMKLYANGNGNAKGKSVSIFLECIDCKTFAPDEKVKAEFSVRIKNKSPHAHRSKHTSHWFSCAVGDWGYNDFIPIADMRDPSKGFINDDCCFLEAEISVQDAVYKPKKPKVEKA